MPLSLARRGTHRAVCEPVRCAGLQTLDLAAAGLRVELEQHLPFAHTTARSGQRKQPAMSVALTACKMQAFAVRKADAKASTACHHPTVALVRWAPFTCLALPFGAPAFGDLVLLPGLVLAFRGLSPSALGL